MYVKIIHDSLVYITKQSNYSCQDQSYLQSYIHEKYIIYVHVSISRKRFEGVVYLSGQRVWKDLERDCIYHFIFKTSLLVQVFYFWRRLLFVVLFLKHVPLFIMTVQLCIWIFLHAVTQSIPVLFNFFVSRVLQLLRNCLWLTFCLSFIWCPILDTNSRWKIFPTGFYPYVSSIYLPLIL